MNSLSPCNLYFPAFQDFRGRTGIFNLHECDLYRSLLVFRSENGKANMRSFLESFSNSSKLIGAELGLLAPLSPHRLLSAHQILLVVVVLLLFLTLVRPIVVWPILFLTLVQPILVWAMFLFLTLVWAMPRTTSDLKCLLRINISSGKPSVFVIRSGKPSVFVIRSGKPSVFVV